MAFKKYRFDLFDLRKPPNFMFFSLQGFLLYGVNYIAVTQTANLFQDSCVQAFPDFGALFSNCGINAWVIFFQAIFYVIAYVGISAFRKPEWSPDAIFNALSILILTVSSCTVLIFFIRAENAAIIADYYVAYFVLAVAVVLMTFRTIILVQRGHLTTQLFFAVHRDEIRLMSIYFILASIYLIFAVYASSA